MNHFLTFIQSQLLCISHFSIKALENQKVLQATGLVFPKQKGPQLFFEEKGVWEPSKISFYNRLIWSFADDQIHLSHNRFQQETFLVILKPKDKKTWASDIPHTCGQDCYQASLSFEDSGFLLQWNIKGPQKNLHLKIHYT